MSDRRADSLTWIDDLRQRIIYVRFIVPDRDALHPLMTRDPLLSSLIISLVTYNFAIFPLLVSFQWRLVADPPLLVGTIGIW